MNIREFIENKMNEKCTTLIGNISYLEHFSKGYPKFTIDTVCHFYKFNIETIDKTIQELTNMNEHKFKELQNELNEDQFNSLMNEESLLVASYNLAFIRENHKMLKEQENILFEKFKEVIKKD